MTWERTRNKEYVVKRDRDENIQINRCMEKAKAQGLEPDRTFPVQHTMASASPERVQLLGEFTAAKAIRPSYHKVA